MTERLHFSLSRFGEGNGNPLQCSCLENPRDGGAWWTAIYGVIQSQTRLKQLSSSSHGKLQIVKMVNFILYILPQLKKKKKLRLRSTRRLLTKGTDGEFTH